MLQTISLKIHSRISSKLQAKIIFWKWICIWSFWLLGASVIRFSVVNQRRLQAQHILRKYTNTDLQIQKYKYTNILSGSSVANQAQLISSNTAQWTQYDLNIFHAETIIHFLPLQCNASNLGPEANQQGVHMSNNTRFSKKPQRLRSKQTNKGVLGKKQWRLSSMRRMQLFKYESWPK